MLAFLEEAQLRMLQGAVELDDTQRLRAYVHSGLLGVEVLTQTCRTCTRRDEARIGEMAGLQQARASRCFLPEESKSQVLRVGRQRVSPLVLAINSLFGGRNERIPWHSRNSVTRKL